MDVAVSLDALAKGAGWALLSSLLLGLQLAACAVSPQVGGAESGRAAPPPADRAAKVVEPVVAPHAASPKQETKKADEQVLARKTPMEPQSKPARTRLAPLPLKSLIGLDQAAAAALIGPPTTVAEQPPAILWEYHDAACTLKLNFFLEVQQKNYRILTVKVEGTDGSEPADQACLDAIRDNKLTQN